ncbi:MAG: acetate/propionate family kinase [Myxococcaceae bacterium]|jgi:acetate kinase|nr:acetate/propionate family kinase [Myxococcaceae bacterium]
MSKAILTLNAGSSTVKYALFDAATRAERQRGTLEETGASAMAKALEVCRTAGVEVVGVGHRVVHGGTRFSTPARIDDEVLAALEGFVPLAPLHQPHNVTGIKAARAAFPGVAQVACFDTAFHRTRAEVEETYALPRALFDEGVRRFGFHGLSYEYVAGALRTVAPALAKARVVIAHLGSGASMCAVRDGQSVASTMGFSTLDGVPMGTRPGALDPGVVLYLLGQKGLSVSQVEALLYKESGLKGLSGLSNDMRTLLASEAPQAALAVEYFVTRCAREVASLATALGGLDGLVFTAGIGERSSVIRARIVAQLEWLGLGVDASANDRNETVISTASSRAQVLVVPTNEERCIADAVAAVTDAPS